MTQSFDVAETERSHVQMQEWLVKLKFVYCDVTISL